ncbi:MAG: MucB/RseB C-terminal domain-containing protein [Pseudomonadota bacterium]
MSRWWFLALGLLAASVQAEPQPDAVAWLQRIAQAVRQLNYSGTFVYQHGSQVETSRIVHMVDNTGEHEKLETLDGPPREIIRDNDQVQCLTAEGRTIKIEHNKSHQTFPDLLPAQMETIAEGYQARLGGRQRVAGFVCQVVELVPRDKLRYGHQLCAEAHTGLLLSERMYDENGNVVEQIAFTQIAIGGTIPRSALKPRLRSIETMQASSEPAYPLDSGWGVQALPPGFRKTMEVRRAINGKVEPVVQLMYSDGIAAVSLFIEPLMPRASVNEGLAHHDAIHIYSRRHDAHLVTVVGEVPAAAVTQFATTVNYREKP